ncbi:PAS domain-containing sensor histidine kinase [Brasilonema octagenarum UFV-E1]|uniref:Circadian input-output histidine kinase CikA n=1 Tax=Brasilonema sennae CENA114 TaxID=415709 RepID=A0A856MM54_9CYAN|nr:ATP-binding protein [Brasilonema sennae]QDL11758.1 PAS domain-containing sensor histidine kinase [Brasilonema sennae CENA114]QDL18139.1 PAS domain-containing sensor histidine kinase [Brasilonema octagenarum UFV-E1]
MNLDKFSQRIEEVRQRSQFLESRASESPMPQQNALLEAIEQLNTALEELYVAQEELHQQNEQLNIANQQAENERQRYQELFDFAPDGYLVTNTDGKILQANQAATQLLNISKSFLIGKALVNFVPEEERRAFRNQFSGLSDIGRMQEWEIRLQARQGNIFDASLSVTPVFAPQDKFQGLRWLVRDITSRKQAEEKLRLIQKENLELQEVAHIKTQMMSVLSHELRTPLNSILGFSQLLLQRYYNLFPVELRDMIERIIKSGKHLLALIENMLDFSKLERDKLELNPEEFNLVELVRASTEELRCLAEQKNLSLVLHANIENPIVINDSVRLRQILVNLISNAIKFTDTGGVFVEVQQRNQHQVVLMVKDTGIGIPESELAHIFQEFWQVDKSTTRKYGGIGLGLAIADKLVRLMNGRITVESTINQGSTFRIQLPRNVSR